MRLLLHNYAQILVYTKKTDVCFKSHYLYLRIQLSIAPHGQTEQRATTQVHGCHWREKHQAGNGGKKVSVQPWLPLPFEPSTPAGKA